jgi:hypothetical protein
MTEMTTRLTPQEWWRVIYDCQINEDQQGSYKAFLRAMKESYQDGRESHLEKQIERREPHTNSYEETR